MKVKKIMTADAGFCFAEENLSKAVEIMRQRDCGVVPVTDSEKKILGMITDRDIAAATGSSSKPAAKIKVGEVIGKRVVTCLEKDDAEDVLKKMRRAKVKRLPVVGENGVLVGIVSITDMILKAPKLKKKIYSVLKAIAKPRPIVLKEIVKEEKV
ncbi:MAG: CBS domain-containing protein [Pyrinomonadaceae bacterium]